MPDSAMRYRSVGNEVGKCRNVIEIHLKRRKVTCVDANDWRWVAKIF